MSKLSVKKPFTVLVAVIVVIILGAVSIYKMQLDLLPNISLPYLMVVTTYPGASAEKVEEEICKPMESSLGVIHGVKNIYSVCNENYGLVELEFQDGTDLDSAMVKVSAALNGLESVLPEDSGTPSIIELSTDMMATQYLAIGYEGKSVEELSKFVSETVKPRFERQDGVASVSALGLIEKTIQIELNKDKVDILNDKILAKADKAFADALEDIDDAKQKLYDSQEKLEDNKQDLYDAEEKLNDSQQEIIDGIEDWIEGKIKLDDSEKELNDNQKDLDEACNGISTGREQLNKKKNEAYDQLAQASQALDQLESYQTQLVDKKAEYAAIDGIINGLNTAKDSMAPAILGLFSAPGMTDEEGKITKEAIGYIPEENKAELESGLSMLKLSLDGFVGKTPSEASAEVEATAIIGIETYKSKKPDIELEIKVLEEIINGYKSKLDEMGVDYTDIEKAKLEAAIAMGSADAQLTMGEKTLESTRKQLDSAREQIEDGKEQLVDSWKKLEDGQKQINESREDLKDGWEQIEDGQKQIDDGWEDYYDAVKNYEKQKKEALKKANADELLSLPTLAQIVYAQNFSMPAGYVDDELDNSWLIKIGDHFESVEDIYDLTLTYIKDVGEIKLSDVSDINIIDNAEDSYSKVDGERAIILSVFKSSIAGTNDVSKNCKKAIEELEEEYPGLSAMVLMDQGDYINLIVGSVLQSMLLGAVLAIIILAIFLKDFRPTFVVALSIPLSVLGALVCMYFSDISLNMLSLSGLALGIGMLVDNSVVVIENIYRLRSLGVEAPRAAVYGAEQVAGSIISSTLTTACVFLQMIYTTGLVSELMMPMCMTIIYCLGVSLLVALTVVPAAGSTILRNTKEKEHKLFDKMMDGYGHALSFCLKVKLVPLLLAIALLALSIFEVVKMGIVIIPDMTMTEIEATLEIPEEYDRDASYELADLVLDRLTHVKGVGSVGVMTLDDTALLVPSLSTGAADFRNYSLMIKTENEDAGEDEIRQVMKDMEKSLEGLDVEFTISTAMSEMSQLTGSGLSINIYGDDLNTLTKISENVMGLVRNEKGFINVSNGIEEASQVVHINIDKNAAMQKGLSVAQIYQVINSKLKLEEDSVTVTIDDMDMKVVIVDEMEPLTYENLMNHIFTVEVEDEDDDKVTEDHPLSDFATLEIQDGVSTVNRKNQNRYVTVTADIAEGSNTNLLVRDLKPLIDNYKLPAGYSMEIGGEYDSTVQMVEQMGLVAGLGLLFIYLVMVAQFQSLLSPFIVLFTIPLAFTGGLFALWFTGENLSMIGTMGFIVLMGTVVNNGIVYVDYANQLRKKGMERREALIATGKTRMRPILMTALTTILAESNLILGDDMGAQMGRGMALVIAGGLLYATLMTLFIIPVMYDILFKKQPLDVDTGSESLDDIPDETIFGLKENDSKKKEIIAVSLNKSGRMESDEKESAENKPDKRESAEKKSDENKSEKSRPDSNAEDSEEDLIIQDIGDLKQ